MNHFINLIDISAKNLRKILLDAKKRKSRRKKISSLIADKDLPLKGKFLIQMFEKSSLRTRLSFYLAMRQLGGGVLNLRKDELHLSYFDLTNDPEEKNNLVLNESYSSSIKFLLDQFILERGKVLHNRLKLLKKNKNESFVNHIFKKIN